MVNVSLAANGISLVQMSGNGLAKLTSIII